MSLNDFEQVKEIGSGSFGTVLMVKRKTDGQVYAMKRVKVAKMSIKDRENALNEVRMLASLCHPNVVDYKEAFYDEESTTLNIIMEYADEGDLSLKIKNHKAAKKFIPEAEIWSCLIQTVNGLKSLHDKKIMNRDLKSANIFLMKNGTVKIGDLNVSKLVKLQFLYTQTGTPYYASPEVWSEKPYEFKSDIWSLGCIIYEMACLKPPFRAQSMEQLYKSVIRGVYEPIPSLYSKELRDIIATLLQTDAAKRPNCEGLLGNSLIRKKMEIQNFNLSTCQGILLKTIRWPLNSGEINVILPRTKRYQKHNEKISDFRSSATNFNASNLSESSNRDNNNTMNSKNKEKLTSVSSVQIIKKPGYKAQYLIKHDYIDLAEHTKKSTLDTTKVVSIQSRPATSISRNVQLSVTPNKNFNIFRKNQNQILSKGNDSNGNTAEILSIHIPLTKKYKLNNLQFKNRSIIFNNIKNERNKSVQPEKYISNTILNNKVNILNGNVLFNPIKKVLSKV